MIAITCSKCGRKLQAKASLAGRQLNCPACHEPVSVPRSAVAVEATIDSDPPRSAGPPINGGPLSGGHELAPTQRYRMGDEIGRGGMGAIVRAVDEGIRRDVAVKFLLNERDGTQKTRFNRGSADHRPVGAS